MSGSDEYCNNKRMRMENATGEGSGGGSGCGGTVGSSGGGSETAGRLSSITNASCELNDDELIEQFQLINEKSAQCVEMYRKYPSIIENEKTAYAFADKKLRAQLERTRAELAESSSLAPTMLPDAKTDMTWKFLEALERTKLLLARGGSRHRNVH